MTDGSGSETYQYDLLGREIGLTKVLGGVSYPLTYQYNYAGELKQAQYPSGRAVAQTFDGLARLSQVSTGTTNYLSNVSYNAASQPTGVQYGNGVQAAFSYNAQMQLQTLAYTKSGSAIFSLTYNYGTGDNGQIQGITDNVDNGRTAAYSYDAWSRLKTAQTTGSTNYPQWGLSWGYDRYGNRLNQTTTAGSTYQGSFTVDPTTNHITGSPYAYDLSGNMTNDGLNTLVYDAENRVTSSGGTLGSGSYAYDGNSLRVSKSVSGATTVYIFSGSKVVAEYASGATPTSPSKEYIYAGSQLLATISGSTTSYHVPDHLSPRVTTDSNGNVIGQQGNYPFGEYSWYASNTTTKWQFTSYERDAESSNDYAMARFNVSHLGRFSSPDPLAGSIGNPQSLNRYTYALNDAVNLVDPSGAMRVPLQDDGWLLGDGGGVCFIDGFASPCSMANGLLAMGAGVNLPPGVSQSGIIDGQFYYLTASSDEDGTYLDFNYMGLTAGQIEALGLPTEEDLFNFGASGRDPRYSGDGKPLHCLPSVIDAMKRAWARTGNGSLGTEAGFVLNGDYGDFGIADTKSGNTRGHQTMTINLPGSADPTFALFHVHPNNSGPYPSTPDNNYLGNGQGDTGVADKYGIPFYVISKSGLAMYDPTTKMSSMLRNNLEWSKPCP